MTASAAEHPFHLKCGASEWTSITRQMTATFADGKSYSGQLFQITSDTRVDDVGPLWTGWHGRRGFGFGGWGYWDAGPQFITHYSGRVVADLSDPNGDHGWVCRVGFDLAPQTLSRTSHS